ncbi:MAG: hypothetical protein NTX49_02150 [Chlamydiae bacterium]|nr:hypothetical protein [Chlamydiota bacterium]
MTLIADALLCVQRALLHAVTPSLRAVVVDAPQDEKLLYIHFYYDGEVSEELIDLWKCAITRAHADFGLDSILDAGVERIYYPQKPPFRGRYAYLRKESR